MTIRRSFAGLLAIAVSAAAPLLPHLVTASASALTNLYVSPQGSDKAAGTSAQAPLKTIQAALDRAAAGVTIHLAPGHYYGQVQTKVNGSATRPITLEGTDTGFTASARQGTVLYGDGRIVSINNSYYHLQGFTINGEQTVSMSSYPTALSSATAFKDSMVSKVVDSTMIFVGADDSSYGLHGVVIDDMFLNGAGGDCIRLRNDSSYNSVIDSTIQWCGMFGKYAGGAEYEYHNGEGVYIGTSPKSTDQPDHANDPSHDNVVEGNVIHTFGSECFDTKENSTRNSFVDNTCADNTEPLADSGSNVELRSNNNTVVGNTISGSMGYGLKMSTDGPQYRQGGNVVENNTFTGDTGASIDNDQTTAQGTICGNHLSVGLSGPSVGNPATACAGG